MNIKTRALKVKSEGGENKIDMGHVNKMGIRKLSSKEQHDKMKSWPKGKPSESVFPTHKSSDKVKRDYQNRFKRAWND